MPKKISSTPTYLIKDEGQKSQYHFAKNASNTYSPNDRWVKESKLSSKNLAYTQSLSIRKDPSNYSIITNDNPLKFTIIRNDLF